MPVLLRTRLASEDACPNCICFKRTMMCLIHNLSDAEGY